MSLEENEVEIVVPLNLSEESLRRIDFHSFVNILNVIKGEANLLGQELAANKDFMRDTYTLVDTMMWMLTGDACCGEMLKRVEDLRKQSLAEIDELVACNKGRLENPGVVESVGNLHLMHEIFEQRIMEYSNRCQNPDRWDVFLHEDLEKNLKQVLTAMERHARGRYHIVYGEQQQGRDGTYFIGIKFKSVAGDRVSMPAVFQDVLRDMVANARKYTPPGGMIIVSLSETPNELSLRVQDSGIGIPGGEIHRVVEYGYRATNVRTRRTLGGGFGLTKAYVMTKHFGGRFWIASKESVGTRIRITLPRPAAQ